MSIEEMKRHVQAVEADITGKKRALADLAERITAALKPFLQEWIDAFVVARVREVPETTKSLTEDQLSEMKRRVRQVQADLPKRLDEEVAKARLWPHETGLPFTQGSRRILPYISKPVDQALMDLHP